MKKFHLFSGSEYYPSTDDYEDSFETEEEARKVGEKFLVEHGIYQWYTLWKTKEDGSLTKVFEK